MRTTYILLQFAQNNSEQFDEKEWVLILNNKILKELIEQVSMLDAPGEDEQFNEQTLLLIELYFLYLDISDELKQKINVQTSIDMTEAQHEIWKHRQIVKENNQGLYSLCKYMSAIDVLEINRPEYMKQILAISPCYETTVATMVDVPNEKNV